MSDNVRLVEHQVEMKLLGENLDGFQTMVYETGDGTASYFMPNRKWEISGKPEKIFVTVTAVFPAPELEKDEAIRVDVDNSEDSNG